MRNEDVQCGKGHGGLDDNIVAVFSGGDIPHVGAVAFLRPSLKNDGTISASASVICGVGH